MSASAATAAATEPMPAATAARKSTAGTERAQVRAVVTGLGIVAPNGVGTPAYWAATLAGRGGIRRLTRFDPDGYPARLAGEVAGFDAAALIPGRLLAQTDHMTRMALVAADEAIADAGIQPGELPEFDFGVITANGFGGFDFGQRELQKLWRQGPSHVSAYQSFAWFYAVNTGQISIRHGLRGPSGVLVTDQAGGLDALGQARRALRSGARHMVTGGLESPLCPWGWTALLAGGRLSTRDDPSRAYLPFDADANGTVAGEGGAILVLEETEAARARGAPQVYGELVAYAATFDPAPGSGREPALRRAIELALDEAAISPAAVDVVFADGAGIPELDRAEARAIRAVFGPRGVPVSVPKTLVGRLTSGGAALDVATALLAMRDGVIPPTVNVTDPVFADALDLVGPAGRPATLGTALVLARGEGGFNAAAVLRRPV
ncbi:ketosynthase chain-length factor [Protofrankia symbiont of Coriaria ruscifolia]|uniref:ketosynthase chain-length factor n=1 Tax=Protofrankia symbiont of Coriaria ruscifolia TaxID=1306542 RepID=UPI00241586CE|nr:ketosynthase chain-length factor [Protofrankia symbiont of Coriaria ruscifolia]